ncbi:MAG: RraA family protein [Nitriliruptor sp.]|nr:MAG: RraA family protein [Nitriliruptor sp.]
MEAVIEGVTAQPDLVERLGRCYTGAVYDVLRERGLTRQVLPAGIAPLDPTSTVAGVAFPIAGHVDEEASDHDTLLAWTRFLSRVPAGTVVVCQPNDHTSAHMGELSAEALQQRGVHGYVVDGGCRDSSAVLARGFPVWCRYLTPRDIVGRWLCDAIDTTVEIGGVRVDPGDLMLADRDGVVVVPAAHAEEVVAAAGKAIDTESAVRRAIRAGTDPDEAYRRHGRF